MPLTLRGFSQWLEWVQAGKPEYTLTVLGSVDQPAGELYVALLCEGLAKELIKPLEADKDRALEWMLRYSERGVVADLQVTPEYVFSVSPGRVVPAVRKVNADRLKSRYPQLWGQCRDWTPYRSVTLAKELKAPPAPPLDDALPVVPAIEELDTRIGMWPVTWGAAFETYQRRIEELKGHKKVLADGVETMARLLTDPKVKDEYAEHWDGHGVLEFECGSKLSLDRMQFSQERALQVIETAEAVGTDLSGIVEEVAEHQTGGSRRLVKRELASNDPSRAAALGNPFEGE